MDNNSIINQLIDDKEKVAKLAREHHLVVVRNPVQMIKGNGTFCESNVEKFVESATNLLAPGESYAIISIIGPLSSGKSFLLNQLFGTNFDVMNATKGRSQTTKGILLAQSQSSKRCALIMDVEGCDGRERGDDGVLFERQSALFALTMSDIMMINMWVYDIGRQQGGFVTLLRTVFQERVKLNPGKTKVLVVVRDYYKEPPFETLKQDILTTMEKIWMSVHDRPNRTAVQFSHYIEVMVVALPHKTQKREFEEEVTKLREWFAKENIIGLRQDKNSTSGFSFSAKNIWEAIKQNKQLDLPSHHLAVSTYVCEKVGKECLAAATRDKDFERLNDAASSDEFIVKLEALLQNYFTRYDQDTEMSDETQRDAKRVVLMEKILQLSSKKNNNSIINQLIDDKEKVMALARQYHHKVVRNPVQMIEGNGTFCESNVEKFVKFATNLLAPGESYTIVSIIGPQSSGKSFLLNQLFGTNFDVMNATKGRSQITKGILLGQSQSSKPCALIMDVEGSNGRERGDDDVSFERQSALFALAVSDIMMINMWLHDIGRQQGGSIPLLRAVFQERVKLDSGKTKVLVVVRDYDDETPFEMLENDILTTMEEIWMSVHDRPNGTAVQFSHYIEVMVVALPHKALKREFEKEVTKLRKWFAKENIVGLRQDKNSTSEFSFSAKNIWKAIKQNKQLDLLSHRLAVSKYVCKKVAKECLAAAIRDEDFERLNDAASSNEFIVKLDAFLQNCVTRYDHDTEMSDETQRDAKRDVLIEKILQAAEPFANKLLNIIRSKYFYEVKDKVTALLDKADDPTEEMPTIVEDFLELFTKSCGGLESKYKPLCLENCNMLRNELTYHAKATILKEEIDRAKAEAERFKEEAKLQRERAAREQCMKEEVDRAKAEAERLKNEVEAMLERKLQVVGPPRT